jgi:hypothetical protein
MLLKLKKYLEGKIGADFSPELSENIAMVTALGERAEKF